MKLKLNPTQQVCLILGLLAIGATIANNFSEAIFIHLTSTLGFGLFLFFIFKWLSGKPKNIWNTVISCLIIFLILHPTTYFENVTTSYIVTLTATFTIIFSKFFLEYKGSPIINPVIFGLLIITILSLIFKEKFQTLTSWWGASFKIQEIPASFIIITVWIIFGLKSWKKFPIFFTYLITFAALILIFYETPPESSKLDFLKFIFTDSTTYFLASIMLVEPHTSPILKSQQIIYGLIAAVFSIIYLFSNTPQLHRWPIVIIVLLPLLPIIVPNLYFFLAKTIKTRQLNIECNNQKLF